MAKSLLRGSAARARSGRYRASGSARMSLTAALRSAGVKTVRGPTFAAGGVTPREFEGGDQAPGVGWS
ncbi:MAG: hypothetical protein IPH54_15405 [Rhodoferax sp.]|nr:hypothetical protein [Rhodoferax sp.]